MRHKLKYPTRRDLRQLEEMERFSEQKKRIFAAIENAPPGTICDACAQTTFSMFCEPCAKTIRSRAGV